MRATTAAGRQQGFTFLEVMVAVAIIAISFVTLIGSQSQSVSIAGESRFRVMSALLAQQKLAELQSTGYDELSSGEGDFGEDFPGYHWRTEVVGLGEDDTGIKGGGDLLKAVDLTVSRGQSQTYAVRTLVMKRPEKGSP